jgi:hypothetical protein
MQQDDGHDKKHCEPEFIGGGTSDAKENRPNMAKACSKG